MIGKHFGRTIHVVGAPVGNVVATLSVPVDCRLKRVSFCGSNAADAVLSIGVSGDTDSILAEQDIGDSGTPAVYDVDDFESTNPTGRLEQGDILVITVDPDGDGGTASQDITVDLDFLEG